MPLSAASITPVVVGPNGTGLIADLVAAVTQAALVGGDAFALQGKEVLVVSNTDGSPHTVTIVSVADNFGVVVAASHDIIQAVAAGKVAVIGPLDRTKFADSKGLAQITYSAITGMKVALYTFSVTG